MKKKARKGLFQAPKNQRISLSIPSQLSSDLGHIARQLGMSKTALIVGLLHDLSEPLIECVGLIPLEGEPDDQVMRMRGRSVDLIGARIAELNIAAEQLRREQSDDSE